MNFLNPFFLIGLAAISIPLIIHLINLRKPERIAFSTTAFLEELQKSTIRRLRIKDYLLLALRILTIVLLVLALADPLLPPEWSGATSSNEPVLYAVLLDNSPSMGQIDANGPYEEQAKDLLRRFVGKARKQDHFMMVNTNGEILNPNILNRETALRWLDRVKVENAGDFTKERLDLIYRQLKERPGTRVVGVWVTDAQKTVMDNVFPEWLKDSRQNKLKWQFFRIGRKAQDNVAISSISLKNSIISRDRPFVLQVKVQNFGEHPVQNVFLSMQIDKKILGQYQVKLGPEQSGEYLFEVPPGNVDYVRGTCSLEGDPFDFDNKRYFSVHLPSQKHIVLVQPAKEPGANTTDYLNNALNAALETGSAISVKMVNPDQLASLNWNGADAVILDGLQEIPGYLSTPLKDYVQEGHGLVMYPSRKADIASYNTFFQSLGLGKVTGIRGTWGAFKQVARFQSIHQGHPILNQIFDVKKNEQIRVEVPDLYYYWVFSPDKDGNTHAIFSSDLRDPLLVEGQYGRGKILLSLIGNNPGWSNYISNPLYAPVQYRTVLYAASSREGSMSNYVLGKPFDSIIDTHVNDVTIEMHGKTIHPQITSLRNGTRISYPAEDWTPGWAIVTTGKEKKYIAVNPDIMESNFATLKNTEVVKKVSDLLYNHSIVDVSQSGQAEIDKAIGTAGYGKEVWYWFLWMGLATLIMESIISRSYKV